MYMYIYPSMECNNVMKNDEYLCKYNTSCVMMTHMGSALMHPRNSPRKRSHNPMKWGIGKASFRQNATKLKSLDFTLEKLESGIRRRTKSTSRRISLQSRRQGSAETTPCCCVRRIFTSYPRSVYTT